MPPSPDKQRSWLLKTAKELVDAKEIFPMQRDKLSRGGLYIARLDTKRALLMKRYECQRGFDADTQALKFATRVARIPSPLVVLADRRRLVVFFEKLPGRSWPTILRNGSSEFKCRVAYELGKNLKSLHSARLYDRIRLPEVSLKELLYRESSLLKNIVTETKKLSFPTEAVDKKNLLQSLQALEASLKLFMDKVQEESHSSEFSQLSPCVVHGDLWSQNIFVSGTKDALIVTILDYEYSMISSPMIDIARVYSRGFNLRNIRRNYELEPDENLWHCFLNGYGASLDNACEQLSFHCAMVYTLIRTINYYGILVRSHKNQSMKVRTFLRSMNRISRAAIHLLSTKCC